MIKGIVPPIPTPLTADETVDESATRRLVELNITAGVGAIWVLGTTGRFDLVSDGEQRRFAEIVADAAGGRVPLILNVSDMGTKRVIERAARYADLPYDACSALCPWYQKLTRTHLSDFFERLADDLPWPMLIYNAPWVDNYLPFDHLRELAEHPRIIGAKDVTTDYARGILWPKTERAALGFSYIIGGAQIATTAEMGCDGSVTALAGIYPELCVETWNAVVRGDHEAAARGQHTIMHLTTAMNVAHNMSCVEVMARHRGLGQHITGHPFAALDEASTEKILDIVRESGVLDTGSTPK